MLALVALLPLLASANPVKRAEEYAGSTTSDVWPPTSTAADTTRFPGESAVGYPGATATGLEPAAVQTAAAYAYNDGSTSQFPLVVDQPSNNTDIFKQWGNLSPWYSVSSNAYGLDEASPLAPETCSVIQANILYRHGARYPTAGGGPAKFAAGVHANASSWNASGDLSFLNDWTYKLGNDFLTPFGRLQNFELGVAFRQQYGHLLNNFTEQGTIPVFRTESQDRMVKTALNFAAGFFGIPEYETQVNLEIAVEASGFNISGAPYESCVNSNKAVGSLGSTAASAFAANTFNSTAGRLNKLIDGKEFDYSDVLNMLQLCAYETNALGYSAFCKLFTEEDFKNFEYYFDLSFYYSYGFGSTTGAAQGKGYLEEWVARFTQTPITTWDSSTNSTLDGNNVTFPLNQSIYADATHEVVIHAALTAFNLTVLQDDLPLDKRPDSQIYKSSQVVPFGTHLVAQVLECGNLTPSKQIRFILNDAVLPIDKSYSGCSWNKDGLCAYDTVVAALQKRIAEVDYHYDCNGDYNATAGVDYNGRAPTA